MNFSLSEGLEKAFRESKSVTISIDEEVVKDILDSDELDLSEFLERLIPIEKRVRLFSEGIVPVAYRSEKGVVLEFVSPASLVLDPAIGAEVVPRLLASEIRERVKAIFGVEEIYTVWGDEEEKESIIRRPELGEFESTRLDYPRVPLADAPNALKNALRSLILATSKLSKPLGIEGQRRIFRQGALSKRAAGMESGGHLVVRFAFIRYPGVLKPPMIVLLQEYKVINNRVLPVRKEKVLLKSYVGGEAIDVWLRKVVPIRRARRESVWNLLRRSRRKAYRRLFNRLGLNGRIELYEVKREDDPEELLRNKERAMLIPRPPRRIPKDFMFSVKKLNGVSQG